MEENGQQKGAGVSKQEMAKRISESVNARRNEEIRRAGEARIKKEKEMRTRPAADPQDQQSGQEQFYQPEQPYEQYEQYEQFEQYEQYPPEDEGYYPENAGGEYYAEDEEYYQPDAYPPQQESFAPPPPPPPPAPDRRFSMQGREQFGSSYDAVFDGIQRTSRPTRIRSEREAREYVAKRRAERAHRRKIQRRKQITASLIAVVILLGAAGAGGLLWFNHGKKSYDGIFLDNTYINGVKVDKLSVAEAAQVVKQYSDMPDVITLTRPDGVDITIPLTDLDSKDNITQNVENFFNDQDHNGWLKARSNDTNYSFALDFSFDREKLYEEVNRKVVEGQKAVKSKNARIEKTPDGFQIIPEVVGTAIDKKKIQTLYDYIDGFLDRGSYSINLKNCNCYKLPKVTEDDLREELGMLNNLYDVEFTIDYGFAQATLEGKTVLNWITFEDDSPLDGFTVNEDQVYNFVQETALKYDSFGKDRQFNSTSRGPMTISQGDGCYGWLTDYDKTTALLIDLIKECTSATFKPYWYTTEGGYSYTCKEEWRTEDSDFSDTYCEVDLSQQHFWYYKDGKLEYQCDIVSGLPTAARNTPGGVYKVWYKELNKTLVGSTSEGESWSTFVSYWNNISTFGVGLHDATWHDFFGGNRYTYAGSHGCINMPFDAAKYVYENIDYDTPVFMYW